MRLAACGTVSAYRRHLRWREVPCEACRLAKAEDMARYRAHGGTVRELTPCGTEAAYQRHRRRGQMACNDCLQAHREYERARYHAQLGRPA